MNRFNSILGANRGGISSRVMRTANFLGYRMVTVYLDANRDAVHVGLANEAIHLGTGLVSEPYLLDDLTTNAAKSSRAQAVQQRFRFLSENLSFANSF